jgi:hypothetical protein
MGSKGAAPKRYQWDNPINADLGAWRCILVHALARWRVIVDMLRQSADGLVERHSRATVGQCGCGSLGQQYNPHPMGAYGARELYQQGYANVKPAP